MNTKWILGLIFVLGVSASSVLFWLQNASRTTQLSFDVYTAAWQLEQPVPIPVLMAICIGIGLLLGMVLFVPRIFRLGNQVRQLKGQVAMNAPEDDPWPTS